jgi:hypothetical protein
VKRFPALSPTRIATLAVAFLLALPASPLAHEIPARVRVLAFVKPESGRLRLLVRVPLESMRDMKLPLRGPGYLVLDRADTLLRDAARIWIADYVQLYENDRRLTDTRLVAARVSLPSDRSFTEYESALASVNGPALPAETDLPWQQAMLDVLIDYPIRDPQSRFSIHPALSHLGVRTSTVLRFLPPGGSERAFEYPGDPGLVHLDPSWFQSAWRFVARGFSHILSGFDHLLFIFCLVIPFRRVRPLIAIVTAFTVAHTITLVASALGFAPRALWFPPLIELLIAVSIVYMALENIVGPKLQRRWLVAFAFGLVHGFGFSFALRESLQFAGTHLVTALVAFNTGVELGQLLVLAVLIPALAVLYRRVAERIAAIVLSALVAHTAWHWAADRFGTLRQYRFEWPPLDVRLAANILAWSASLMALVGVAWVLSLLFGRLSPPSEAGRAARAER